MDLPGYIVDWDKVIHEAHNTQRVLIRLPPGFMRYAPKIMDFIQNNTGGDVLLSAEQCYGACDYPHSVYTLKDDTKEKVFHFGEAPMPSLSLPSSILFFEAQSRHTIEPLLQRATRHLEGDTIGIATTTPYLHTLQHCKTSLTEQGYHPLTGKGGARVIHDGQILGCDLTAATTLQHRVDSYLYIGDGTFHPLGISLASKKPVIALDPTLKEIKKHEIATLREKILRQRYSVIARVHNAESFGIIICKKIGQERTHLAQKLRDLLKQKGKKTYLLSLDTIMPSHLDYLPVDCFVSTACPRIALDDYALFKKPLLTPIEVEILLGVKEWETYKFDQIL